MKLLVFILLIATQLSFGQTEKIRLLEFKYSACDNETLPSRIRTRIIKKEVTADILTIDIATVATCCVNLNPLLSVKQEILQLDFEEMGAECECSCYYTLTYKVKGIRNTNIKIKFQNKYIELSDEKYITYPVKFKIQNGDTINYVDKYGFRQGKWAYSDDTTMTNGFFEARDDVPLKLVTLYPDKKIKTLTSRDEITINDSTGNIFRTHSNYNYYLEYYESGAKKKECFSSNNNDSYKDPGGKCKEWTENGELVYEGVFRK